MRTFTANTGDPVVTMFIFCKECHFKFTLLCLSLFLSFSHIHTLSSSSLSFSLSLTLSLWTVSCIALSGSESVSPSVISGITPL